jgi:hypothetical protein
MLVDIFFAEIISHFQIFFERRDDIVIIVAIQIEVNMNNNTQANQTAAASSDSPSKLRKYISTKSTINIARIHIAQARVILFICPVIFPVKNLAMVG